MATTPCAACEGPAVEWVLKSSLIVSPTQCCRRECHLSRTNLLTSSGNTPTLVVMMAVAEKSIYVLLFAAIKPAR